MSCPSMIKRPCRKCGRKSERDQLVCCSDCSSLWHKQCLGLSAMTRVAEDWRCPDCDRNGDGEGCRQCGQKDEPECMILCDSCDSEWHMHCVGLRCLPHGDWLCPECETLDGDGQGCRACHRKTNPDRMIICDGCEAEYHLDCLGLGKLPRGDWLCPECSALGGDGEGCRICARKNNMDSILLCDGCESEYHLACLGLNGVPRGDWYCDECRRGDGDNGGDGQGCRTCGLSSDPDSLLICDSCNQENHLQCLGLKLVPAGYWICPSCEMPRRSNQRRQPKQQHLSEKSAKRRCMREQVARARETWEGEEENYLGAVDIHRRETPNNPIPVLRIVTFGQSERSKLPEDLDFKPVDVRHFAHPLHSEVMSKSEWLVCRDSNRKDERIDGRNERLINAARLDDSFPRLLRRVRWFCGRGRPESAEDSGVVTIGIADWWGTLRSVAVAEAIAAELRADLSGSSEVPTKIVLQHEELKEATPSFAAVLADKDEVSIEVAAPVATAAAVETVPINRNFNCNISSAANVHNSEEGGTADKTSVFSEGDVVIVAERAWPGMNKPGGVGHVVMNNDNVTLKVKYVHGGSDKSVPLQYVQHYQPGMLVETSASAAAAAVARRAADEDAEERREREKKRTVRRSSSVSFNGIGGKF